MYITRIAVASISLVLSYALWHYISGDAGSRQKDGVLPATYFVSRCVVWCVFAIYLQKFVSTSDARLFYQPMLEHLLAGQVPVRDFFYPYGPFLIPMMLPLYLLCGRSLAGISLFAIVAEVLAVWLFLKSARLLEDRGEIERPWVRGALAVYILNPATLYWTVLQGYHSVTQTTYSMAALYFLLCGRATVGYGIGLFSLAGTKLLAILDWPALLVVYRPRPLKLLIAALPLLVTYAGFQRVTGDAFADVRYHINIVSEGNVWYLLTLFGDLRRFYSRVPGSMLPILSFGVCFLIGVGYWLRALSRGITGFSFQSALGLTTFSMSLFFLFSFYTGSW